MLCNVQCSKLCNMHAMLSKILSLVSVCSLNNDRTQTWFQWACWTMTGQSSLAPIPGDHLHACPFWRPVHSALSIRIGKHNCTTLVTLWATSLLMLWKQHAHPAPSIWQPQMCGCRFLCYNTPGWLWIIPGCLNNYVTYSGVIYTPSGVTEPSGDIT